MRFHRVGSSRPGRRGRPPRATLPPRMRRRTGTAAHRDRGLRRSCPSEATKRIGVGHRGTRRGDARIARRSRFSSFPIRARAISKHFRCPGGPACSILFPSCSRQLDRGDFGDLGQGTRARELARNHPQPQCASLRCLPPGSPALIRPAQFLQHKGARLGRMLTVRPHPRHLRAAEHL